MKIVLSDILKGKKRIALSGHVRPDGDCVGSSMGLYLYLTEQFPEIEVDLYLEKIPASFSIISRTEEIRHTLSEETAGMRSKRERNMICLSVWTVGTNSGSDRLHHYFDRLHIRFVSIIM